MSTNKQLTNEYRAHELAMLFVKYKMDSERRKSDYEYDENDVFELYKSSYNNFYDSITAP